MKEIICKDCGKSFSISPKEEKFYISKGLQVPKRCKECRKKRKEQKLLILPTKKTVKNVSKLSTILRKYVL